MVTRMEKDSETAGKSRPQRKITLDTPYHNPQMQGPKAKIPGPLTIWLIWKRRSLLGVPVFGADIIHSPDDSHGSVLVVGDPSSPVRLPVPTIPLNRFARKVAATAPANEDVEINAVGFGTHAAIQVRNSLLGTLDRSLKGLKPVQVLETAILAYHLGIAALQAIAMLVLKPLLIDKGCWPNYEAVICTWAMTQENDPVRDLILVSLYLNTIVLKGKFGPPLGRLRNYDCLEEMWLLRLGFLITTWLRSSMPVVERKIFHQVWHMSHAMGLQGRWEEMQDSVRDIRGKYLFDHCFLSLLEPGHEGDIEYQLEQLADYHYLIGVPGSLEIPNYTVNVHASSVEDQAALKAQAIENPKPPLKRAAESRHDAQKMQKKAKKMQKKAKTTLEKHAKATKTEAAIIKEELTDEDRPAAESLKGTKTTSNTPSSAITTKKSLNGVEQDLQPHADDKADGVVNETATANLSTTTTKQQHEASAKSDPATDPEPDADPEPPLYISQASIDMFRSGTFDAKAFDESYRGSYDNSPYFKRQEIGSTPPLSTYQAWQVSNGQRRKSMRENSYTLPADLANDPRYSYENSPFFKRRDRDTLLLGDAGGEESQGASHTEHGTTWRQRLGLDRPQQAATMEDDADDLDPPQEDLALSQHDPALEDDYDADGNYKWATTYNQNPEVEARWRKEWYRTGQDGILERRLARYAAEKAEKGKE